jgi:hypothetical protein
MLEVPHLLRNKIGLERSTMKEEPSLLMAVMLLSSIEIGTLMKFYGISER